MTVVLPSQCSSSSSMKSSKLSSKEAPMESVAVYCASSLGKEPAYQNAAISLGRALAAKQRPLVYGGGSKGIMGVVSGAVLEGGGRVTGVVPFAMIAAGGEADKTNCTPSYGAKYQLREKGREKVETVVVESMHERKVQMAHRSCGFVGLPGGFGTFEEVLEVTTWTQIGIHNKPIILVNVLSFWNPLRDLVRNAIHEGFIPAQNERLIIFVDGPADRSLHESFDWGAATLQALDDWERNAQSIRPLFDWGKPRDAATANATVGVA